MGGEHMKKSIIGIIVLTIIILISIGINVFAETPDSEEKKDEYLTVADLESNKQSIQTSIYMHSTNDFNVTVNNLTDEKSTKILVEEKEELTERSYKSILSIIEVLLSPEKAEYFESNYPSFSEGDKKFANFKVSINPEDELYDKEFQAVLIIVDKEETTETQNETIPTVGTLNELEETEKTEEEENSATEKIPQTGENTTIMWALLFAILAAVICLKKYSSLKDIK